MAWNKPKENGEVLNVDAFFKRVESEEVKMKYLKVGIWGPEGCGKTYFSMTAPEPILIIDTDGGAEGVRTHHFEDKDIRIFFVDPVDYDTGKIDVERALNDVEDAVKAIAKAVKQGGIKTVVLDSGTDIWNWMYTWLEGIAHLTKIGTIPQFEWGKANERWRKIFHTLKWLPVNFILTGQEKVISEKKEEVVKRAAWQKQTRYWVDIKIKVFKKTIEGSNKWQFCGLLEKIRFMQIEQATLCNLSWNKLIDYLKKIGVKVDDSLYAKR